MPLSSDSLKQRDQVAVRFPDRPSQDEFIQEETVSFYRALYDRQIADLAATLDETDKSIQLREQAGELRQALLDGIPEGVSFLVPQLEQILISDMERRIQRILPAQAQARVEDRRTRLFRTLEERLAGLAADPSGLAETLGEAGEVIMRGVGAGLLEAEEGLAKAREIQIRAVSVVLDKVGEDDPRAALDLLDDPDFVPDLPGDLRLALAADWAERMEREVLREKARVRSDQAQLAREVALARKKAIQGAGSVRDDESLQARLDDPDLAREMEILIEARLAGGSFLLLPPEQQKEVIGEFEADQADSRLLDVLRAMQRHAEKLLQDDPLLHATTVGLVAPPPAFNLLDEDMLAERAGLVSLLEAHYGRPVLPVTLQEADLLAEGLTKAGAEGCFAIMKSIVRHFASPDRREDSGSESVFRRSERAGQSGDPDGRDGFLWLARLLGEKISGFGLALQWLARENSQSDLLTRYMLHGRIRLISGGASLVRSPLFQEEIRKDREQGIALLAICLEMAARQGLPLDELAPVYLPDIRKKLGLPPPRSKTEDALAAAPEHGGAPGWRAFPGSKDGRESLEIAGPRAGSLPPGLRAEDEFPGDIMAVFQ